MLLRENSLYDVWYKKTNLKIAILEILVYKIQPEIMKSTIFTRFNFITKPCSQEWLYFVYQNFQNGYFRTSLFSILFEVICGKWIFNWFYFTTLGNGLFQKKSKQGELRTWNFWGYLRKNMWKFQESIKEEVEFLGVFKKN